MFLSMRFVSDPQTHEVRAGLVVIRPMKEVKVRQLFAANRELLYGTPACGFYTLWINRPSGEKIRGGVVFPLQYSLVFTDVEPGKKKTQWKWKNIHSNTLRARNYVISVDLECVLKKHCILF